MTSRSLLPALFLLLHGAHAQEKTAKPIAPPAKTADTPQLYRNAEFGFRYRIPYGWVDRTKEMQQADEQKQEDVPKSQSSKSTTNGTEGEVLLAVFERPPEASGDSVNSAVVIATEDTASYPDVKRAEDYLDQLDEITTAKGFKPDGNEEEVTIDSRSLVRADFTKALNDKLTMYQSTLVLLAKKQIVSFTFVAGSKDEIDDLIDALSFASSPPGKHP
jgi:hypothetical protein